MSTRPRPALIAHRGMPRTHRENTLAGFLAAAAAGADGWELDVHGSRDGVVVVHHDPMLPSFAGKLAGSLIADVDWSVLAEATIGPSGERMPSLDAVLAAATPPTIVCVEIKARAIEPLVLASLGRYPGTACAIHSFDHRVARRIHDAAGHVPVGILVDSYLVDAPHALAAAGARDYWAHREMVDQALVDAIHAADGRVIVWTVNESADARRLAALGVDALCSDVVDDLRTALGA